MTKNDNLSQQIQNKRSNKYQKKEIHGQLIIIQDLSTADREKLTDDLLVLCKGIFGNLTHKDVLHYITESGAEQTYLMKYLNNQDEFVGFFALHLFKKRVQNKDTLVFRAQAGLLHNYRRSKANMYFSLFKVIKYRLKYPFKPIYCFITTLSPSMYCVLAERLSIIYPKIDQKISSKKKLSINELMKQFSFDKDPNGNQWVSPVGLTSVASHDELDYWSCSDNPYIKYYLELNPDFQKGNGSC